MSNLDVYGFFVMQIGQDEADRTTWEGTAKAEAFMKDEERRLEMEWERYIRWISKVIEKDLQSAKYCWKKQCVSPCFSLDVLRKRLPIHANAEIGLEPSQVKRSQAAGVVYPKRR